MNDLRVPRLLLLAVTTTLVTAGLVAVAGPAESVAPATTVTTSTAVPCQRTYLRTLNTAINDNSVSVDELDVPEDGLIVSDVDVLVDIHHTRDSDLTIKLLSREDTITPRTENVTIFGGVGAGSSEVNMLGTVFDDSASSPITWGDAPYTGRFKPTRPIAQMNGFAGGMYDLAVDDNATNNTGTWNDWALTFRYKSCDFDHDGVEDHVDRCLGTTAHTVSGCPVTTRKLSSAYSARAFRGAMSSATPSCRSGRPVVIWKVRSGPDLRLGTAVTSASGTYKLARRKHAGTYYATSARALAVLASGNIECPPVSSHTFKVH